jgi:hypothetical protein
MSNKKAFYCKNEKMNNLIHAQLSHWQCHRATDLPSPFMKNSFFIKNILSHQFAAKPSKLQSGGLNVKM